MVIRICTIPGSASDPGPGGSAPTASRASGGSYTKWPPGGARDRGAGGTGRVWVPGRRERTAEPRRTVLVAVQSPNGTREGRGGRAKSPAGPLVPGILPGPSSGEGTWKYLGTIRPPGARTPSGRSARIYPSGRSWCPPERDSDRLGVQSSGDALPAHPAGRRAALCLWRGNGRNSEAPPTTGRRPGAGILSRYPVAAPGGRSRAGTGTRGCWSTRPGSLQPSPGERQWTPPRVPARLISANR